MSIINETKKYKTRLKLLNLKSHALEFVKILVSFEISIVVREYYGCKSTRSSIVLKYVLALINVHNGSKDYTFTKSFFLKIMTTLPYDETVITYCGKLWLCSSHKHKETIL